MLITSTAFKNGESIPEKYTCDGEDVNPPLSFWEIPTNVKSFSLIMDDPDAPNGTFTHWVIWNLEPSITELEQGLSEGVGLSGPNSFGQAGYGGPCPPSEETHRYFFKLYALDTILDLSPGSNAQKLNKAMEGHIIESAEFYGIYKRKK